MEMQDRHLHVPELLNVRDLGGCLTRSGAQTRWRSFLRADDLGRLNRAGRQALLEYGVQTVIDLRWPQEATAYPSLFQQQPPRLTYHQISLLGTSEEVWRANRPKVTKETANCAILDQMHAPMRQVLQTMADAAPGAILFHCVSGKDRTGLVAALLLALADVEPEVIAEDYAISASNLRDPYLAMFPNTPTATLERVRCPPEHIFNTLNHLERVYGGVIGYLSTIGLSQRVIVKLQQRLSATV